MDLVERLKEKVATGPDIGRRKIYSIGDGVVAKLHRVGHLARKEYDTGTKLFEHGVQVPEFYSHVRVESPLINDLGDEMIFHSCIFMQEISDAWIIHLRDDELKEALKQYKREITKVLDLGIYPHDSDWGGNSLFSRSENKLYLIDFEDWDYNPEKVQELREKLNKPVFTFREGGATRNVQF